MSVVQTCQRCETPYVASVRQSRFCVDCKEVRRRERTKAARRRWYEKNRERALQYARSYRESHSEQVKEGVRSWFARNPERKKEYSRRYWASRASAEGAFTAAEFDALCAEHDRACAYCGCTDDLTADHVVALSRGGSNYIENIVPACRPCNSAKRDKPLEDFLESGWLRSRVA